MPQEGSGSAAPMDPAAIEAVRATSSSRKQPLASPERPVTPYDRHVVSHDASRPSPSSRSPLALEPSEGGETSPHRRGASSSAMRGGMASCGAAHLAVMAHGDAWPPPLEGERARDPSLGEGAETEKEAFSRRRVDEGDDASAVVYGLDGTVSTVRVPPVLSPGSVSYAPSDRVLQGPGSRLGAEKCALPGGRLRGSLPLTGEPRPRVDGLATTNSRPGTREGGRVTASEVFNAITGARVTVVADAARAGDSGEATESATREKASEAEDAFPERSGPFALRASLDGSASSVSESDDEPVETLAIARARREGGRGGRLARDARRGRRRRDVAAAAAATRAWVFGFRGERAEAADGHVRLGTGAATGVARSGTDAAALDDAPEGGSVAAEAPARRAGGDGARTRGGFGRTERTETGDDARGGFRGGRSCERRNVAAGSGAGGVGRVAS